MRHSYRINLYDILHVSPEASSEEIKSAFRVMAMRHHPDKNANSRESTALFQAIYNAYTVLSDPASREDYDSFLGIATGAAHSEPAPAAVGSSAVVLRSPDAAEAAAVVLNHLNQILWELEDLLRSARPSDSKFGGLSSRDYLLMMLSFIDKWVLSVAGFPDYFFRARGVKSAGMKGGTPNLPYESLRSSHRPYPNVDDYFYDVRRRADRLLNRVRLVDLFAPLPGTSFRLIDCIFEAHNYCIHYLGWLHRALEENISSIPPFRHSDVLFDS